MHPNYFSMDRPFLLRRTLKQYLRLFEDADPRRHLAVGEASTRYLRNRQAAGRILDFNPDAKMIVMLRDPVDHFHSLHTHMVFNGMEKFTDPQEAWRAEKDRARGKGLPFLTDPRSLLYSGWSLFGEQMAALFARVPREKVLVILNEDLARDTAGTYRRVLSFLGVPDDGRTEFPKINESHEVRRGWFQKVLRLATLTHEVLEVKFGLFRKVTKGKILRLNAQKAPKNPLPEPFRKELAAYFREDVQKLSKLLDRDLSHWST